jgi:quinol monooxygenase YgiN
MTRGRATKPALVPYDAAIVVTDFIQVATKDRDGFLAVLHDNVPRVRRKDGCIAYAFAVDAPDPNLLRMSEVWRDLAALNAHLADDEFKGTLASLAGLEHGAACSAMR